MTTLEFRICQPAVLAGQQPAHQACWAPGDTLARLRQAALVALDAIEEAQRVSPQYRLREAAEVLAAALAEPPGAARNPPPCP